MRRWLYGLLLISRVVRADCLDDAAAYHHVDARLLRAIAQQESGMRDDVIATNRNGTRDIGRMQINSSWLPTLARFGITERKLLDGCVSSYVGAWILAHNFARLGLTWDAVGAYNAVSPDKRARYATQIYRRLMAAGEVPVHPMVSSPLPRSPRRSASRAGVAQAPAAFFSRETEPHLDSMEADRG